MKTSTTALVDQADAATRHGLHALQTTAEHLNNDGHDATLTYTSPGPITESILARLNNGLHQGRIGFCPHLSATAPQPAVWVPWASGVIRCAPCSNRVYQRIKGRAEDRRCDHCRRRTITMHTIGTQIPALVLELPGRAAALPPIQVHFGLCPTCKQKDN